jgi:elongation factor Ts
VKAEDILRIKLGNKASKASSRVAAEGIVAVFVSPDGKLGSIIEVNCETDFVAKNEDFLGFARRAAELAAARDPADVTALSALPLDGATVEEVRKALVGKIGENVSLRRFARVAAVGRLATYIHGGAKVGVIMRDIAAAKAAESGKPANIVEKMVAGSVQKILKEKTLLGQPFVKDDKQSVEQVLTSRGAQVHAFYLYVVGEGLEKRKDDFVAEVMAQAKQAGKAAQPG